MKTKRRFSLSFSRKALAYPYMAFLLLFVVTPLVLILINAFISDGELTFSNFVDFFSDSGGLSVLLNSLVIGLITTLICLAIGYPVAYFLAKYHEGSKVLVLLFILPMWVNFLIRTLSTKAIFTALGVELGMGTVVFGMVYNYLPFMILPLHTALVSIDHSYIEAAEDLGCDGLGVFLRTIFPLSLSGIISGITMVFIPAISTFAISELLSNRQIYLFGDSINTQFTVAQNFGVGSVMSLVMLVFVIISNVVMNKFNRDSNTRSVL
jgi:spermidine/putrescine transport system permease protein